MPVSRTTRTWPTSSPISSSSRNSHSSCLHRWSPAMSTRESRLEDNGIRLSEATAADFFALLKP
ncbi:MAG: hypothetical protein E5W59_24505, partial [Mesorhizobium sp.]